MGSMDTIINDMDRRIYKARPRPKQSTGETYTAAQMIGRIRRSIQAEIDRTNGYIQDGDRESLEYGLLRQRRLALTVALGIITGHELNDNYE